MAQWNTANGSLQAFNKTLFEAQVPADRHGNIISGDYYLDIAKGKIPGATVVFLSGRNTSVNTAILPSTIWNAGQTLNYPWTVWNTGANNMVISSNSVLDIGTVTLVGLDSNYVEQTETITINDGTPVTSTKKFLRLNSAVYQNNTGNAGQINIRYANSAGTIVGRIDPGQGITSMSIYTVPAGHTAFSVYGDFSVNKNESAQLISRWRFYGGSFLTVYSIEVYQQAYSALPPIPGAIPEKTDIENACDSVGTNGSRVYSNQQLLLIQNDLL